MFTYEPVNGLLDGVNLRLLRELRGDPRLSMTELGRRVGMSSPAVTERVRRMEEAGVIRGYRSRMDQASAFCRTDPSSTRRRALRQGSGAGRGGTGEDWTIEVVVVP